MVLPPNDPSRKTTPPNHPTHPRPTVLQALKNLEAEKAALIAQLEAEKAELEEENHEALIKHAREVSHGGGVP